MEGAGKPAECEQCWEEKIGYPSPILYTRLMDSRLSDVGWCPCHYHTRPTFPLESVLSYISTKVKIKYIFLIIIAP